MSKENAKRFLIELVKSDSLKKDLGEQNPSSPEELVSFAGQVDYMFTQEEMREALIDFGALIILDNELGNVARERFPA